MPRAGAQVLLRFPGEQQKPDKEGVPSDSHSRNLRQVRVCMIEVRVAGTWGARGALWLLVIVYTLMQVVAPPVHKRLISPCCSLRTCNPHPPARGFQARLSQGCLGELFLHPPASPSAALGGLGALTLQRTHDHCSETHMLSGPQVQPEPQLSFPSTPAASGP